MNFSKELRTLIEKTKNQELIEAEAVFVPDSPVSRRYAEEWLRKAAKTLPPKHREAALNLAHEALCGTLTGRRFP